METAARMVVMSDVPDPSPGLRQTVKLLRPLNDFVRTEAASGLLLLVMVVLALAWVNGPLGDSYERVWTTDFGVRLGQHALTLDLRSWINEGLMAVFFFVIGLEIKREISDGRPGHRLESLVPVAAAVGGMVVPALMYLAFTAGSAGEAGWGIPMATDIAMVLGVLAVAGRRVPTALKTFLLTLAVVDDVGAIAVIAVVYSEHSVRLWALVTAVALLCIILVLRRTRARNSVLYLTLAIAVWLAVYAAGVHATIAGVALALVTPSRPINNPQYVDAERLADISSVQTASETVSLARGSVSAVDWLEHLIHPWSSYIVLPIFALANAGLVINADQLRESVSSPVSAGVVAALVLGKPIGICVSTWVAVRLLRLPLATGLGAASVGAGAMLAGIGFTVSLFVADLAFSDAELIEEAKIGVLFGSLVAGAAGFLALVVSGRNAGKLDDTRGVSASR